MRPNRCAAWVSLVLASFAIGCGGSSDALFGGSGSSTGSGGVGGAGGAGGATASSTTTSSTTTSSTTTSSTTTSSTTTSSTTSTTTGATTSSSTGGGDCAEAPGDTPCTSCLKGSCCDTYNACLNDANCGCWSLCVAQNPNDLPGCFQKCGAPSALTQSFGSCAQQSCGNQCGGNGTSSSSSASGGGDPCAAAPGDDACTACTKTNCCDQYTNCAMSKTCTCWAACYAQTPDFAACFQQCGLPDGATNALGGCVNQACQGSCN